MVHSREARQQSEPVGDLVRIFRRGRRWHANYQVGGRQHRRSLRTTSKKEAVLRAARLESELRGGGPRRPAAPAALTSAVREYLQFLRTERRSAKTLSKYQYVLDRLLQLAGERRARTLADVDLRFVDAYRHERAAAGKAPKTIYTESVVIRQLVNFGLSRGLIDADPLRGLRLSQPKPTPQPCWTRAEVEAILAASQPADRPAFAVLADTGMRFGELCHLSPEDVDFDRGVLHVRPKADWRPKTGDQRAVPMSPRVKEVLGGLPMGGHWVLTAPPSRKYPAGNRPLSERRLLASLKRVLKRLGLKGHLHTFRHAFISDALERNIAESQVRQWVGHADAEVMKLYVHITDRASQAAMQRLAEAWNDQTLQTGGSHDGRPD